MTKTDPVKYLKDDRKWYMLWDLKTLIHEALDNGITREEIIKLIDELGGGSPAK